MLKIEQFVKDHFDIVLTKYQLETIALIAAGSEQELLKRPKRSGTSTAYKSAMAYLQDGLTEVKK